MDEYSLFFVIAISLLVISSVFMNIVFSLKLKKLTVAITQSNSELSLKVSNDITEYSNIIVNQLSSEFALLTDVNEFIRNNLKLYSETVIVNLSELYKNSAHSMQIHENALRDITSIMKNGITDLKSITINSINNSNKAVVASIEKLEITFEKLENTLSVHQNDINTILKNGLHNIDKSLRETIDVN